jgi:hypothetical protein
MARNNVEPARIVEKMKIGASLTRCGSLMEIAAIVMTSGDAAGGGYW